MYLVWDRLTGENLWLTQDEELARQRIFGDRDYRKISIAEAVAIQSGPYPVIGILW